MTRRTMVDQAPQGQQSNSHIENTRNRHNNQGCQAPIPLRIIATTSETILSFSDRLESSIDTGHNDASDHNKNHPNITIIKAELLIPGADEPIPNAALVIQNSLIAWVGTQAHLPDKYTSSSYNLKRSISVPYLMPGLWDVHTHFGGRANRSPLSDDSSPLGIHPATAGARLSKLCWESLQRGYTSLRDLAGYGCEVSQAIQDGTIVGPNIYSSGACLSQTAGHGDIFDLPAGDVLLNKWVGRVTSGYGYGGGTTLVVDGVEECRRAVRLQIRRGARVIKALASGGVLSRDDNPLYPQFSPEEMEVIVKEASRQGLVVAAHVHGKEAIMAALKAGVKTVEHASFADQECIDLIAKNGAVYVATRTVIDLLMGTGGKGLPEKMWEKVKLVAESHTRAYKLAIEAMKRGDLEIALGTDSHPGFNMAVEIEHAVKMGMTNLEAIKCATANGPLTVGDPPKSGQLKVGYEADVIALEENPVEDVRVLQKSGNVKWVWKGGKVFKGPGVGPWGEDYEMGDDVGSV